eukprot:GFUD01096131.1.p1 GENE.GFUD01096131.1~~GFUD01096131.1.p1  ORF type:complete len:149 (+),score=46.63 GFUD01096131.1:28-447(+)
MGCVIRLLSLGLIAFSAFSFGLAVDESCQTWEDCNKNGKKCDGIQDVGCICKNGQCKISSGCGTMGAFFFTPCSNCEEEDCEDEEACKWMNGKCRDKKKGGGGKEKEREGREEKPGNGSGKVLTSIVSLLFVFVLSCAA